MQLRFVDLHRGAANRSSWLPPFDCAIAYQNEHWWGRPRPYGTWYVQVLEDAAEVARVELDDPGGINPKYAGVSEFGLKRLETQFIEVATAARGRGVGTEVVRALEERHSDRRLFAYSEEAHGFWASLGWDRFDHPRGEQYYRHAVHPAGSQRFLLNWQYLANVNVWVITRCGLGPHTFLGVGTGLVSHLG